MNARSVLTVQLQMASLLRLVGAALLVALEPALVAFLIPRDGARGSEARRRWKQQDVALGGRRRGGRQGGEGRGEGKSGQRSVGLDYCAPRRVGRHGHGRGGRATPAFSIHLK